MKMKFKIGDWIKFKLALNTDLNQLEHLSCRCHTSFYFLNNKNSYNYIYTPILVNLNIIGYSLDCIICLFQNKFEYNCNYFIKSITDYKINYNISPYFSDTLKVIKIYFNNNPDILKIIDKPKCKNCLQD